MRKNTPVTDRERTFGEHTRLISSTDLEGRIVHCNDDFAEVSGFTREELIGQPHNIVRHPDMPQLAYQVMWAHLKSGRPWMGLVKNRCKNGDYYWVDAYVTPVTRNGKVIGYESVRFCPKRDDIARAEKLYRRFAQYNGRKQNEQPTVSPSKDVLVAEHGLGAVGVLAGIATWWLGLPALGFGITAVVLIGALSWLTHRQHRQQRHLLALLGKPFTHELAVRSYTDNRGDFGRLCVALKAEQSHLSAVLTRISEAADTLSHRAGEVSGLSSDSNDLINNQQAETEQVATAMNEMSSTIQDVSQNVQETARNAGESNELAQRGAGVASESRHAIEQLSERVNQIDSSVRNLAEQTERITAAAGLIEQIAEQTNLLALNAAIEAARAGEQGRGFAVVADEVRNLAQRTQNSTKEIHTIIQELTSQARESVSVAELGQQDAQAGVRQVQESEQMLSDIAASVQGITTMADQMAAAVEEQSHVSDDINRQVTSISTLARDSLDKSDKTEHALKDLNTVASDLTELVVRFRRD